MYSQLNFEISHFCQTHLIWYHIYLIYFFFVSNLYVCCLGFLANQEQQRRALNMVLRTEPRTSSWSLRTVWRSVRGTSPRSLSSFRKCSLSSSPPMSPTWSRSNRVCLMEHQNGRPRSASQVRGESLLAPYSSFEGIWLTCWVSTSEVIAWSIKSDKQSSERK